VSAGVPLIVHRLAGDAHARGLAQAHAAGTDRSAVRDTALQRYADARAVLEAPAALTYLDQQRAFAQAHCGPEMAELDGLCTGYGLDLRIVFALLHLSILSHRFETDGCTAFARPLPGGGAVLAKNRDLTGLHRGFQAAFVHDDPAFAAGPVFALGTFGAPGVYSSGINAAGLALADTAIAAPVHRVGWLRYLLMTRILATCADVGSALALIASCRHAGGGSLILADATGAVAAVELLADGPRVDRASPAFRTNHFRSEDEDTVTRRLTPAAWASTSGRSRTMQGLLAAGMGLDGPEAARAGMTTHGAAGREALCRHGEGDGAHTVSTVIYSTSDRSIALARGTPCTAPLEAGRLAALAETVAP